MWRRQRSWTPTPRSCRTRSRSTRQATQCKGVAVYLQVGRPDKIHVPYELREAVELYAREHGRTGSLHCIPPGVWFARFSLRPNDKALSLYQKGEVAEAPTEVVYFQIRAD